MEVGQEFEPAPARRADEEGVEGLHNVRVDATEDREPHERDVQFELNFLNAREVSAPDVAQKVVKRLVVRPVSVDVLISDPALGNRHRGWMVQIVVLEHQEHLDFHSLELAEDLLWVFGGASGVAVDTEGVQVVVDAGSEF
ncbi:hypothetical protein PG997_014995 [Apiospora hydei]|uniref:Uncharacterized protein n=1 Tax=Apiospora hydei TaxID=1337664 RepID=A0ABR1UYP4_9PEZI